MRRGIGQVTKGHAGDTLAVSRCGIGRTVASVDVDRHGYRRCCGRAVGLHSEGVVRLGGKAGDGVGHIGDTGDHNRRVVVHRVGGTSVAGVGPGEGGAGEGDIGGRQVGDRHARGHLAFTTEEVVDGHCGGSGTASDAADGVGTIVLMDVTSQ